jgi:prepilin-type N-terminal cleavage/methylation domain-containing protein
MRIKSNKGFSLAELMIGVAIVGFLAAVAVPNYTQFALRARFAEAKMNLAAVYSAEAAYRDDYESYTSRFDAIGFQPIGSLYFNVGFDNDFPPPLGTPQGTPGCYRTCPPTDCGPVIAKWQCLPSSLNSLDGTVHSVLTESTFIAGTHAHFTTDPRDWYTFVVDEHKNLRQIIPAN